MTLTDEHPNFKIHLIQSIYYLIWYCECVMQKQKVQRSFYKSQPLY